MTFKGILHYLKKNYIVAFSGAIIFACLIVHFVRGEQITRLAADYDDLGIRRSRILKNLKFAADIDRDLERLAAMQEELEARLFRPEDLASNQRYFYRIESMADVSLKSLQQILKPAPTGKNSKKARRKAEQASYQEIVYDMGVEGTFENVISFLRAIEGGEAIAYLEGFSMVGSKTGTGDPLVEMRMTVDVLGKKS